ncbi:MAG: type III CRISPR-associated RAMP protein Csx7 [bacterium]
MLKQLLNECLIDFHILPQGPILIRSGIDTISGPDMAFVRVWRDAEPQVYLPGSSLKGVMRSHAERIARTLNLDAACDPFAKLGEPATSCGHCFDKRKKDPDDEEIDPKEHPDTTNRAVYRDSCPICRLFGSTWYAGRLATADAYAIGTPPRPQPRDGVGIDRFTGGAAPGVKFDLEVVTEGCFKTSLHLRNFELWQLGLVGFLLQDLKDELIRVGGSKSRGMGKVRGEVQGVTLHYLGRRVPEPTEAQFPICGVGALGDEKELRGYDICPPYHEMAVLPQGVERKTNGLRTTYTFPGDTFPWGSAGQTWVDYATRYEPSKAMRAIRGQRED